MRNTQKIIILAKSIDGGTGTFVNSLLKPSGSSKKILPLVLEQPQHRSVSDRKSNFRFFKTRGKYPQSYSISIPNILGFIKESMWVNRQIKTFGPDILLGVGVHANLLLMFNKILKGGNIPTILTTHIELNKTLIEKSSPLLKMLLSKIIHILYNQADINICVSKKAASSLKNNFGLRKYPKVIYNGIPVPSNPKITPLKTKAPVFIIITRLTAQKAVDCLIKAFNMVSKKVPEGKLLIVGDGPKKPELERLVKKLRLGQKIQFTGWTDKINPYLKKSNIFVLSSTREGLPYALLEAMSQGKPVVSTNAPSGPSEILDKGKFGLLVPVNYTKALGQAMIKMGTNKSFYNKFARLSLRRSHDFSESKMLEKYEKVISSL